jgi:DNA-binding transcriptional MerR regulator
MVDSGEAEVPQEAVVEPEVEKSEDVLDKTEISDSEIKELLDANDEAKEEVAESDVEKEVQVILKKEDIASMEAKIDTLIKSIDALQKMVDEKVKSIEVIPSKKSVVKITNPSPVAPIKKQLSADEDFLNIIVGNK